MRLNSKNRKPRSRKAFACLCLAGGLLFLGMVFGLSRYSDMQSCEDRMNELIDFVKEQSSAYVQYNETAVAKALVRGTTAMQELDGLTLDCGEDALRQYTERLWLTGVSVVDAKGRLVCEYSTDGIGYAQLQTDLEPERVLAVIGHPQSTYVRRVQLTDGSFADTTVHSLADGSGAVDLAASIYIDWGAFINAVINFLLIAFVLFCIVKTINKVSEAHEKMWDDVTLPKKKKIAEYRKSGLSRKQALAKYEDEVKAAAEQKAAEDAAAKKAAAAKEADGVDNLLGDLSSGKNAPKTGGGAKGNNASAAGSGNTKNSASGADINNYAGQIKSAIESKFYDASSYAGKTCTLRIKLAPDGLLLNIQSEGGDPALCQAALAAARQAKFPKPPSQAVYEVFKNAPLDFKPQ